MIGKPRLFMTQPNEEQGALRPSVDQFTPLEMVIILYYSLPKFQLFPLPPVAVLEASLSELLDADDNVNTDVFAIGSHVFNTKTLTIDGRLYEEGELCGRIIDYYPTTEKIKLEGVPYPISVNSFSRDWEYNYTPEE